MMGYKLENGTLNFKTIIGALEADLQTVKPKEDNLKTLYESDNAEFIAKTLKTRQCNLREIGVV